MFANSSKSGNKRTENENESKKHIQHNKPKNEHHETRNDGVNKKKARKSVESKLNTLFSRGFFFGHWQMFALISFCRRLRRHIPIRSRVFDIFYLAVICSVRNVCWFFCCVTYLMANTIKLNWLSLFFHSFFLFFFLSLFFSFIAFCKSSLNHLQLSCLRSTHKFDFFLLFLALWCDILTLICACSALTRTISVCLDSMSGGMARIYILGRNAPENEPWPDVIGFSIIFIVSVMFMLGLEVSNWYI